MENTNDGDVCINFPKIEVTFASNHEDNYYYDDDDNVSPYISVANPEDDIKGQLHPDEIVIPMKEIRIEYSYPLSTRAIFFYDADNGVGFTRAELARKVSEGYQRIYREEDEAVGNPGNIPGMLNRETSDGPYGIWGHGIGDLALHTVRQIEGNLFGLGVDS